MQNTQVLLKALAINDTPSIRKKNKLLFEWEQISRDIDWSRAEYFSAETSIFVDNPLEGLQNRGRLYGKALNWYSWPE